MTISEVIEALVNELDKGKPSDQVEIIISEHDGVEKNAFVNEVSSCDGLVTISGDRP